MISKKVIFLFIIIFIFLFNLQSIYAQSIKENNNLKIINESEIIDENNLSNQTEDVFINNQIRSNREVFFRNKGKIIILK